MILSYMKNIKNRTDEWLWRRMLQAEARSLPDLSQSQLWSLEQLQDFQNRRLRTIVAYAYKHISGYREKYDRAGVKPSDIHNIQDLYKLPTVSREEMRDNDAFTNQKAISGTLYTGGSTGLSLRYFESAIAGQMRMNAHQRGWLWGGYDHDRDRISIIGSSQGVVPGEKSLNLIGNLSNDNLAENARALVDFKPACIRGYVSSVYIMALYCLQHEIQLDGVRSVNVISENLYDFQREVIEKAFQCPVFEEYVCNDGGACAWECSKHEGLHYCMERAIIESVNSTMVVTDLWNLAMPFIRYLNGDSVEKLNRPCSCGRSSPLITVRGRDNDILISPEGPISPSYLLHTSYNLPTMDSDGKMVDENLTRDIQSIQFVQLPDYHVTVNIVPGVQHGPEIRAHIEETLTKRLPDMKLDIEFVPSLPTTPKGKRQFVINHDKQLIEQWKNK